MTMKPSLILSLTLLLALALFTTAAAQSVDTSAITDDQVNAIAKQLFCPVCENVPLDVCGTQACAQWRELIREKLALGWSEDQIKDYFVLQYGDRVLATPPAHGLNWLAYIVPPLAFIAGVFILYRGIQSWRSLPKQQEPEPQNPEMPVDDYISRLEEELRRSDQ
jgi:cytochrome c-type biogenesis protein CcmH